MNVSKLTIDKRWLHQQSKQTEMLLWLQQHPEKCDRTTIRVLVRTMLLDKDLKLGLTMGSAEQVFYALMRRGFVERYNGVRRASFRINYYHPALPPAVKNNKPNDVVDVIHIDQPKEEKKPEKEEAEIKKPKEIVKTEEPEHQIEPQIEIKKDGEKIQLSITLNINIK